MRSARPVLPPDPKATPATEARGYTSSDDLTPGPLSLVYGADRPDQRLQPSTAYQPDSVVRVRLQVPRKLSCLFIPKRYKIVHGGRGGAKSWSFARALIIMGSSRKLRILCCREVQNDITESVHQVIKTQLERMDLAHKWTITDEYIRNNETLTEFVFQGLSTVTEKSIKGFEDVDVAWVEEAESVKKSSWQLLIPTIRKPDSFGPGHDAEIWISFNPQLDTDYTYKEFVESPPEDSFVVEINWRDNPWFPPVLQRERERAWKKAQLSVEGLDEYNNIWEGRTRAAVSGAIYAEQVATLRAEGRYTMVPWTPKLPVHLIFDLGWNDFMFVIMVQKHLQALAVIEAIQVDHTTLADLSADIRYGRKYRWGQVWLPHDGKHGTYLGSGLSAIQEMKTVHGWTHVKPIPMLPVEQGIKIARGTLPMTYIDAKKGEDLMTALRRYRRDINKHGEGSLPVHDDASHGADCYRYLSVVASRISNELPQPGASYTSGRAMTLRDEPIDDEMGM